MYWTHLTHWKRPSKIERADMDGANRRIAIQFACSNDYPTALALDVTRNWLYWVDYYYNKLEVYEFPSNTRREIIAAHSEPFLSYPGRLALLGDHLFWTSEDWNLKAIYRADRETGEHAEAVLTTQNWVIALHACEKDTTVTPGMN